MSLRALARAFLVLSGLASMGEARAADAVAVVTGPGDQSAPSVSGPRLAYTDDSSGTRQVWVHDLATGAATQLSSGAVDHGAPDLDRTTVAFTGPDGLHLMAADTGAHLAFVPATGAAHPSLSPQLVAWEQAGPGGRDVAFMPLGTVAPQVIAGAGDEHAPSASYGWIAWLDESGAGAIRLRDAAGAVTTPFAGRAGKVSLWASSPLASPLLAAVVTGAAGDPDLVVLDATGERARLARPGEQRNPTLFGEWVGFEDLSTGVSQVGIWQWSTGRVVFPSPSSSDQVLNDVAVEQSQLRVAWADARAGNLDVYLFTAALPLPDLPPGQATCDDPVAPVLADLTVHRTEGRSLTGSARFGVSKETATLVCIDAAHVSSAWVALDCDELATPGDFDPHVRHLEARRTLAAGDHVAGALVLGKPGASLRVRVLADGWTAPARSGCLSGVDCPLSSATPRGLGCATGGAGGVLALLAPLLLLARSRRRSRRS
ncbi:MAG TPA: hypothetical protein VFP50_09955 [Anaeromyxobacteraceae bacterium]|nr:hypothetical protein [Anaeromyxobacteraceae bacterium]